MLTHLSGIRLLQTELDKAKYEFIGRKLMCLRHPFTSPRVALGVSLKHDFNCENEIDMYNHIEEVIDDVLIPQIQQGQ